MAENVEQSPGCLRGHTAVRMKDRGHTAVRMKDRIVVFVSFLSYYTFVHDNWTYNLLTEKWRKCPNQIPQCGQLPETQYLSGVAIGSVIYLFGGLYLSNLWKLTQNTDGSFDWNLINMENHKTPSPRCYHCGWEYGDKMWIFGGFAESPVGYLNDHGDFEAVGYGNNNQLFSFDPSAQTWKNIGCSGDVPLPRGKASAAVIKDKAWLYGGRSALGWEEELYELNMNSLTWTHIHTDMPRPQGFSISWLLSSLTPLTDKKLLLHSNSNTGRSTWIFHVESYQWREYQAGPKCNCEADFTCLSALDCNGLILSGNIMDKKCHNNIFSVVLEPKCLQKIATRKIFQYEKDLPWQSLPPSLIRKVFGTDNE